MRVTYKHAILLISTLCVLNAIEFITNEKTIIPSSTGYTNAARINQTVRFLADQLSQNKDFANISDSKLAITSFVNVENLRETNKLGNLISEHLIHDMQIRGYRVVDYKAMPDIEVGDKGDYAFSRRVANLKQNFSLNYVLTGTYTFYTDGVSLNARIIDLQTNVVMSTAQAFIPRADIKYIIDSITPFQSMQSGSATNTISMDSGSGDMSMPTNYLIPGTEGTTIKIKKAHF